MKTSLAMFLGLLVLSPMVHAEEETERESNGLPKVVGYGTVGAGEYNAFGRAKTKADVMAEEKCKEMNVLTFARPIEDYQQRTACVNVYGSERCSLTVFNTYQCYHSDW
jgi:hypothetical protein